MQPPPGPASSEQPRSDATSRRARWAPNRYSATEPLSKAQSPTAQLPASEPSGATPGPAVLRRLLAPATCLLVALTACAPDPPNTIAAAQSQLIPIVVDAHSEARRQNDGELYEFVSDSTGYVSTPAALPAGEVTLTLTYIGDRPAPHSLVFEGLNQDQPIVAVDFPGSNNGTVVLPAGVAQFYDGAPGNRAAGFEGKLTVSGHEPPDDAATTRPTLSWTTSLTTFTNAPTTIAPANVPLTLELTVTDHFPHSVALEDVRDGQPLVAVDGPGTNQRSVELPEGTYIYYCAVPGHREAGMEGLLTVD